MDLLVKGKWVKLLVLSVQLRDFKQSAGRTFDTETAHGCTEIDSQIVDSDILVSGASSSIECALLWNLAVA